MAKKALTRPVDEHSEIPYVKELEEELLEKINKGLANIKEDGTYDKLVDEWFNK